MNKQQLRILTVKILPKALILILLLGGIIAFWSVQMMGNSAERDIAKYREETNLEYNYDSVVIDKLTIRYPEKYKITDKYGKDAIGVGGGYTFKTSDQELTFNFLPKETMKGMPSSITSVDEVIKGLENSLVKDNIRLNPKLAEIKIEKIGDFAVHVGRMDYNGKSLYFYGLESENYYFTFTSHLSVLLDSIVQNLKGKKP
ncbi:hypothetical protein C8C85_1989 [Flavobacterium sp. 103]|uniref:hypothetical protein n=1 Tax=Flavobacterium sp. 103 TaxID=2135624 RepID=UPI000D5E2296|nr:hypothetical protein [Flavobacterium sp. 103]PVX46163.1 hypothetical protein C8C85_1989 [Flavobacterium sp. 103]